MEVPTLNILREMKKSRFFFFIPCISGTLMGAGDFISQVIVERKSLESYDGLRTGRFLVFGFCVFVS